MIFFIIITFPVVIPIDNLEATCWTGLSFSLVWLLFPVALFDCSITSYHGNGRQMCAPIQPVMSSSLNISQLIILTASTVSLLAKISTWLEQHMGVEPWDKHRCCFTWQSQGACEGVVFFLVCIFTRKAWLQGSNHWNNPELPRDTHILKCQVEYARSVESMSHKAPPMKVDVAQKLLSIWSILKHQWIWLLGKTPWTEAGFNK